MLGKLLIQIQSYTNGESDIKEFEDWLVANLEKIEGSGNLKATEIADSVDSDFAFLSEGLIDQGQFFNRMLKYVSMASLFPVNDPATSNTSYNRSDSVNIRFTKKYHDYPLTVLNGAYQTV